MKTGFHVAVGSTASLLLGACNPPAPVDPAANLIDNFVITAEQPAIPPAESRRDRGSVARSANQEPSMPDPEPNTTPPAEPPAKTPAPPPRRIILPSPTQPPAEIDPVRPDPGD